MKNRTLYKFGPLAALGLATLVALPIGISSRAGPVASGPIEGITSYPRGTGGPVRWTVFYNPQVSGNWEFKRIAKTPNGEQTVSYLRDNFQSAFVADLGRPIKPTDLRHIVTDFTGKGVPYAHLVALEITLGCPTAAETAKTLIGKGTITR